MKICYNGNFKLRPDRNLVFYNKQKIILKHDHLKRNEWATNMPFAIGWLAFDCVFVQNEREKKTEIIASRVILSVDA